MGRRAVAIVGIAFAFACALACSSKRRPADPACVHWLNATMSWTERCGVPLGSFVPTVGESRRWEYEAVCERSLYAAGATRARAYLEDCATKLEARECSLGEPLDCEPPPGELPTGGSCTYDFQCGSGWCKHELLFEADILRFTTCGVCTERIAIGDSCNEARFEKCVYGSHCLDFRCDTAAPVEYQRCSSSATCEAGLRCEATFGGAFEGARCERRLNAGAACSHTTECAGGLTCAAAVGMGEVNDFPPDGVFVIGYCRELHEGEPCSRKRGCLRGLGCDPDKHVCVPIKYVAGDEACDDNVRRCKSGICIHPSFVTTEPSAPYGICPIPIDDGTLCTEQKCELPAICSPTTGRCELPDPSECK